MRCSCGAVLRLDLDIIRESCASCYIPPVTVESVTVTAVTVGANRRWEQRNADKTREDTRVRVRRWRAKQTG